MQTATATVAEEMEALVRAAEALRPLLLDASDEIERERRLPEQVVTAMKAAGAFRMAMPRAWGGPEADPMTQVRIVEAISRANGSAGWCAMIGSDGGYLSAYLEQGLAREMWADLDAITAFVLRPGAVATAEPGGFRLTGRFPFASTSLHATWLGAGALLLEDGRPKVGPNGSPLVQVCVVSPAEVTIHDTWYSTGVRGSGSNDFSCDGLFVPAERSFVFGFQPPQREGPLYAWPNMFLTNMSGCLLGVARDAIDTLTALVSTKVSTFGRTMRDDSFVLTSIAKAEAKFASTRAYVFEVLEAIWEKLLRGERPSGRDTAQFRLSLTYCFDTCVEIVDLMYHAGGGSSLYAKCPLDRHLRDAHTMHQHTVVWPATYEAAGRVYLGLEPGQPMF